jgi:hypothetical protein
VSDYEPLFSKRWVHVFEEDGPEGAVYRPEDEDIPLSRRPRQRLAFSRDGTARIGVAGPDDRVREVEGRWREEGGEIKVTRSSTAAEEMRVRVRSADCLLVRR